MARRETAADRFARIVSIVPWVAEREGPTISEICERFQISPEELQADLDVVFMVGIPPYTPDELVDVIIDGDRVWIEMGDYFKKPLRLTASEALGLLVSARAIVESTPHRDAETLLSAVEKLSEAIGAAGAESVSVGLGDADPDVLATLRQAVSSGSALQISYYSHGSDSHSKRVIEPLRLYIADGNWYVLAHCRTAESERVFRVDRIEAIAATGEHFDADPNADGSHSADSFRSGVGERRITLQIDELDGWMLDEYPAEQIDTDGETARVTVKVGGNAWAERLLLTFGPKAKIVAATDEAGGTSSVEEWEALRSTAAERILERYRT